MTTHDPLPAPLVPAEVDLRGYGFMPFYGNHLLNSDFNSRAPDNAWRAAVTLWWAAWVQVPAASLPDDDVVLASLAGMRGAKAQWRKVRDVALHGFVRCSDGRLYHRFLAPLAMEAWARRQADRAKKQRYRDALDVTEAQWLVLRRAVFRRDGSACVKCGDTTKLHCDHIKPTNKGGTSTLDNLQTLCEQCHGVKTIHYDPYLPGMAPSQPVPTTGATPPTVKGTGTLKRPSTPAGGFQPPDWINPEAWNGYCEMRVKIRKPMTQRAKELAVLELEKLRQRGHDPLLVLNQSTFRSWQGLFPVRADEAEATAAKEIAKDLCDYCEAKAVGAVGGIKHCREHSGKAYDREPSTKAKRGG